jgi:uncharacterized membrane protein YgdD (TMEM256/DUF423 family)
MRSHETRQWPLSVAARGLLLAAALLGASSVALGAFSAHGLSGYLERRGVLEEERPAKLAQVETATRLQLAHAVAMLAIALAGSWPPATAGRLRFGAAILMGVGSCLFAGGIYASVLLGRLGHWSIIPSGGLLLIVGWTALAASALFSSSDSPEP